MKKISKNKKIKLFSFSFLFLSPFIISMSTVSCGSNENKQEDVITNELQKLVEEGKIKISPNPLGVPKEYFNHFQNNDIERQKFFFIQQNDLNLNLKLEVLSQDFSTEGNDIKAKLKLINLDNNEEYTWLFSYKGYGFRLETDYAREINDYIAQNIYLKKEYENQNLIDLLKSTPENGEFIKKFIDLDRLNSIIIGINFQLKIVSQNLDMNDFLSYFRFQLKLLNYLNEDITPPTSNHTPHLKIDPKNQITFTIINNNDLNDEKLNLSSQYFGQTLIRIENPNVKSITLNKDFSRKNIINELDFSFFDSITFGPNASFIGNSITNVFFNSNAELSNLKANLFTSNYIDKVILSSNIINYDPDCFDKTTIIQGLENLNNINLFYDSKKDLRLDIIKEEWLDKDEKLNYILKVMTQFLSSNKNNIINNVYLPSFKSSVLNNFSIECNRVIFTENINKTIYEFENNISSWKIKKINIPSFIIGINKYLLPSTAIITREFNDNITNLIQNNSLIISKKTILDFNKESLINIVNSLDDYFYSFSSDPLPIYKIIFDDFKLLNLSFSLDFFKNSNFTNKEINISSNVAIIDSNTWDKFKSLSQSANATLNRESWLDSIILDDKKILHLDKFYQNEKIIEVGTNLNYFLMGYESKINSIDLSNVNTIKQSTFDDLNNWSYINIVLPSNITTIEAKAFYNTDLKISLASDFNPTSILENSFAYSQIMGDLNFSNLSTLGIGAFSNTKITSIVFEQLTSIADSAFNYCSELLSISLPRVTSIGKYAFNYCSKLTSFDFRNITKLDNYAFAGCSSLNNDIHLNNDIILGQYVFNYVSSNITIYNFDITKYQIFNNLFSPTTSIFPKVFTSDSFEELAKFFNFDLSTKIWDMSSFTDKNWKEKEWINKFWLFANEIKKEKQESYRTINHLILPNESDINNNFMYFFNSSFIIKKISWSDQIYKNITDTLLRKFSNAKIESIDENFFVGATKIPKNYLLSTNLQLSKLNFQGVTLIEDNVFANYQNLICIETLDIRNIGSNSFNSTVSFEIGPNVKVKLNSFGGAIPNQSDNKIIRNKIFDSSSPEFQYYKIYNQQTKVLDFSKIEISNPYDATKLIPYQNIYEFLFEEDVNKLILPKLYILPKNLFDNLYGIEEIVFQRENQIILKDTFKNTTIINKPNQNKTSILLDLDNFFN